MRKQPLEFPPAFYREPGLVYYQPDPGCYSHKKQPQVSVAESSLPKYLKRGKSIIPREECHADLEEKVPFSFKILEERLPKGYRPPAIGEYDGSKDLEDHLRKFRNAALLHQYNDVVKCRVFLNTLSGFAQNWFDGLPHGSITCFSDFKIAFLRHFMISRKYQKTCHCLFALKQGSAKPLRSYIKRFNQVAQDVPLATSEILMSAFSHGLTEGEFFRDLIRNPVKNFDEMLEKAASYINVEEAQTARRKADKLPPPTNRLERRAPQLPAQPLSRGREARPTSPPLPRLSAEPADCVHFARDSRRVAELGLPPPELAPQVQRMIEERRNLAGQAGRPRVDQGGPKMSQQGHTGEPGEAREAENRGNVVIRDIGIISGGPIDGDSGRARKSHERRLEIHAVGCSREQAAGPVISFGPQDLEGLELPHDDTLIIKVVIANSRVVRVFVDIDSFVNVLFRSAFEELQIDSSELQLVATSLYGFTGNEVRPMGQIKLVISLGSEPLVSTRRSTFIVVDSPSSYNVILGRPTLNEFRAAVSTFHQKIKFPVGEQVGEVRGEQWVSQRCYLDMVKIEARKA
ncbi:uncharacterized protein LOC122037293 [Zingiber officinale]|uniref:uncharacterized protein LOC122037293 n=1 Tax=Zingiber officinale TaxID=94328 RepID=UPI001C4DC306|nr:uncharacterized protein LOC122037293 [Zingiber officinale]